VPTLRVVPDIGAAISCIRPISWRCRGEVSPVAASLWSEAILHFATLDLKDAVRACLHLNRSISNEHARISADTLEGQQWCALAKRPRQQPT
jgi:hypothetical protein